MPRTFTIRISAEVGDAELWTAAKGLPDALRTLNLWCRGQGVTLYHKPSTIESRLSRTGRYEATCGAVHYELTREPNA